MNIDTRPEDRLHDGRIMRRVLPICVTRPLQQSIYSIISCVADGEKVHVAGRYRRKKGNADDSS